MKSYGVTIQLKPLWLYFHLLLSQAAQTHVTRSNVIYKIFRQSEGLTLETSAFSLFTVANLPYQLSW